MITKKEIKSEIRDIKTLMKAMDVVIADRELRNSLILKMADKMMRLIRIIIKERDLHEQGVKYLTETMKGIESHIFINDWDEKEIFADEHFKITAEINCGFTEIEVMVLDSN